MLPHAILSPRLQVQLVTEGDIVSELYMLIEGEVELIPGTGAAVRREESRTHSHIFPTFTCHPRNRCG